MKAPINLNILPPTDGSPKGIFTKLKEVVSKLDLCYRVLRSDTDALENKVDAGVATGWFDDGTNFRVTVTNGIITAIGDSSGAGHS